MRIKKNQTGFTIVELLIVIVVIGILAALVITTYSGIQAKARNSQRQSDIQSLQTNIEGFYTTYGYYPSNADLNSSTWRATNMKSLDVLALQDPKSLNSNVSLTVVAAGTYDYWYIPQTSASASCETTDTTCATYTLGANLESSGTYTKSNLD